MLMQTHMQTKNCLFIYLSHRVKNSYSCQFLFPMYSVTTGFGYIQK